MTMQLVDLATGSFITFFRGNYARENLSLRRRSREPSRVGCL